MLFQSAKLLEEVLANKAAPPPPPSPPVGGPPIHIKGKNNPAVDAASRYPSNLCLLFCWCVQFEEQFVA